METLNTLFASINYRDPLWIAVAYLCGFLIWQIGLPPMVGYLFAGFILSITGAIGGEFLHEMADLGVTLLLFTIGLKLNVRQLLRPEIWAVASIHMASISLGTVAIFLLFAGLDIAIFKQMTTQSMLIVGFALSFSSTVFAVKVFEDKGGMNSQYGRIAIGVLIVQDIAAVIFLSASTAKMPSIWAAAIIIILIFSKPLLVMLLKRAGHGELLILYGLVLALGGSSLFELVSLKGDLGALFFGVLLAHHPKSSELAKSLLSLKDLFLVGFFLSIGMSVTLSYDTIFLALVLLLLIPIKILLFSLLFTRFRLRSRPAKFASLSLANFSEFGLIVTAIAVNKQWLGQEWLAVMAIAVVFSFIIASPLNVYNSRICKKLCHLFQKTEHHKRLPEDDIVQLGDTQIIICGMGRIGTGAYDHLHQSSDGHVVGIDFDDDKIKHHQDVQRKVIQGDSGSPDFWQRIEIKNNQLELVMLCMPNHEANINATEALRGWGFKGKIAAVTKFFDEEQELHELGVDVTFNMYAEVGTGFAQQILQQYDVSDVTSDQA